MVALRSRRWRAMAVDYAEELKLFRGPWRKAALVLGVVLWLAMPLMIEDFWLGVLGLAAIGAIGGIGLNLLTGYTGQVSLGHAFFIGAGAFGASWFGAEQDWPLVLWLPMVMAIGAVVGAIIGPFALRLRGDYLVIVTLGLVFAGGHLYDEWDSVTGGGGTGISFEPNMSIGGLDFANLEVFGTSYSEKQAFFWLSWAIVAVVALLAANLVRSRAGRAMQAVRDRDVAAEVIGVSLARYKIGAFALSSAFAALAGGLFGAYYQYAEPGQFASLAGLTLSIQYIAIIVVGGVGTILGAVLGALLLGGIPEIIREYSSDMPVVSWIIENWVSVDSFNLILYGVLLVAFLLAEPRGLAAVWFRLKTYFRTWPFSY
jgi:branched-chain amino acid transport system permease protein